jgi:hypothetical protein
MSGLKIVKKDGAGQPTEDICPDGYVAVTAGIILDQDGFDDFKGTGNPGARADYLKSVVDDAVASCVVTTKTKDVAISHANCHVFADPDVNYDHAQNQKAKHTVPMPPEYLTTLCYLDEYIQPLVDMWTNTKVDEKEKARRYLYGVMMLTKCR